MQQKFVYSSLIRFENKMCADMLISVVRNWKEEYYTSNTVRVMLRIAIKLKKRHFKRKAIKLRDILILNHAG